MNNNNNRFLLLRNTYSDKIITPKKDYDAFLYFVKDYYQPEEITEEESVYNATYKKGMFRKPQKRAGLKLTRLKRSIRSSGSTISYCLPMTSAPQKPFFL